PSVVLFFMLPRPARSTLFPYTTLFRSKRQYPPEAYAQACNELSRQGVQIVITGVNAERELADQLAWAVEDGVSLASQLSLGEFIDRKSTRLNSSHVKISYAVFCLKKKT